MANPTATADMLTRSADRAAERQARSTFDQSFQDFTTPQTPDELISTGNRLKKQVVAGTHVGQARANLLDVGKRAASAADFVEEQYYQEERGKANLGALDDEIDRLVTESFRILPTFMARTDILDPAKKRALAQQAIAIHSAEIKAVGDKRKELEAAADARAKIKVDTLKAKANVLDKEYNVAKADMDNQIELMKFGMGNVQDLLDAAVRMDQNIKDRNAKGSGSGNPFVGLGTGKNWDPSQIAMFQYFEAFGDWPVADSSSKQVKAGLTASYSEWVRQGKPGQPMQSTGKVISETPLPEGVSGPAKPNFEMTPINPFAPIASDKKQSDRAAMMQWLFGGGDGTDGGDQ